MHSTYLRRNKIILTLLVVVMVSLSVRTGYVMLIWGKSLSVIGEKQYTISENISNIKYSLQDISGKELLSYIMKYYFVIDMKTFVKNNRDTDLSKIKTMTYILRNYKSEYDLSELANLNSNQKLYYSIDEDTYNKLKEVNGVKGVYVFKKSEVDRSYSWRYENMLTNYLTSDNKLKSEGSIERYVYEKTKNNEYPKVVFNKDIAGDIKDESYELPKNNVNLKLTTDKNLEEDIKEIISKDKYKSYNQIGVILMDPSNGKIKAMVQRDDEKPNILLGATVNGYEPGSIFKTITQEAAMDYAGISTSVRNLCEETKKSHGNLNMEEAFIVSCNDYFKNLGNKVKFTNILPIAEKQGLFNKVLNFDGDAEAKGLYSKAEFQDSNLAIGQSLVITPIQAVGIVNTVVNNGVYIKPYLIDAFINDNGNIIEKSNTESNRVIKVSTAKVLKSQMIKVVEDPKGTGKYGKITGVEIGGKTGTTERSESVKVTNPTTGLEEKIVEKHSDGWFIGFAKVNGKYYTAAVFVKDIKVEGEDAGVTAVPIFKEVIEKLRDSL